MRTYFFILAALFLFPMNSFAGMEGRYELDADQMIKNMTPMLKKRVPPSRLPMVLKSIKARIGAVKSWFVLSKGSKFAGYSQRDGKKAELKATGSWSAKGKTVLIKSITVEGKKKQTLSCSMKGKHLLCDPPKQQKGPKFQIPFRKK